MKRKESEAIARQGASGPIEGYLGAIVTEERLPAYAIGVCLGRIEEAAPPLRALVARAADGEALSDDEVMLLFRGLYILSGARDKEVCRDLLRLLRRSETELDDLLGDILTESMARLVASVFDGDAEALLSMVADRSIDPYAREQILGAATFLTWNGNIAHERMQRLLVAFYEDEFAEKEDQAWFGWQRAIALLGLRELAPLVYRAIDEGYIPEWMIRRDEFHDELAEAELRPGDITRFEDAYLGYIEDVADALAWTDYDDAADQRSDEDLDGGWMPMEPVRNPLRHVGRNDPCPCGSGKKYKKCCLANQG